jgi:hypothetical protein
MGTHPDLLPASGEKEKKVLASSAAATFAPVTIESKTLI